MKNMMNKVSAKINNLAVKGLQAKDRVRSIFTQQSGEGFVDTALV